MTDENLTDTEKDFLGGTDKNPSHIEPKKLTFDSLLKFSCHPGVPCFTACCHNIKIILTPFDILKLRHRLDIPASKFVTQYTQPTYLEKTDMPGVQIKLREDTGGCPFVTPEGCTVYEDRPSACRYYPVGMADFHEGGADDAEEDKFFFLVKEPHCKGFEEEKEWRLVSPVYADHSKAPILFREAHAMLVPYVKFNLRQEPDNPPQLDHLYLGPTSNINISMNSLRMFLSQNGIVPNCGIDYCQIPYRQR